MWYVRQFVMSCYVIVIYFSIIYRNFIILNAHAVNQFAPLENRSQLNFSAVCGCTMTTCETFEHNVDAEIFNALKNLLTRDRKEEIKMKQKI